MNPKFKKAIAEAYKYADLTAQKPWQLSKSEVIRVIKESASDMSAYEFQDFSTKVFEHVRKLNESVMAEIDTAIEEVFLNGGTAQEAVSEIFNAYQIPLSLAKDLVEQWVEQNPQPVTELHSNTLKSYADKRMSTFDRDKGIQPGSKEHRQWKTAQKAYDKAAGSIPPSQARESVDSDCQGNTFSVGDSVKITNAKKYDSLATSQEVIGEVIFIWDDGTVAVQVENGQTNVEPCDLVKLNVSEAANPNAKIQKQIEKIDAQIERAKGQLGMARDRRVMAAQRGKGSGRIQSSAETQLQSKIDRLSQQKLELNAQLTTTTENFSGAIAEVGYADSLGELSMSHDEIISAASSDGTISQRGVMKFTQNNTTLYFFNTNDKIDALVLLKGNNLKAIKNFTDEKGLVFGLMNYIVNMTGTPLVIRSDEPLTTEGFKWVAKLIRNKAGLRVRDQDGNEVDVEQLKAEWQKSKQTGGEESGPTELVISEASAAWKKKLQENEKSPMPYHYITVTENFSGAIAEKAAPGQEDWILANKARFIDQYGKEKGLEILYATAWKRSKKNESVDEKQINEQDATFNNYGPYKHFDRTPDWRSSVKTLEFVDTRTKESTFWKIYVLSGRPDLSIKGVEGDPEVIEKHRPVFLDMIRGVKYNPARYEQVTESKGLGKKVKIVKGPKDAVGKIGTVGEIRKGAYKGAPKELTVDYTDDYGRTVSIQLMSNQVRIVRDEPAVVEDEQKDPVTIMINKAAYSKVHPKNIGRFKHDAKEYASKHQNTPWRTVWAGILALAHAYSKPGLTESAIKEAMKIIESESETFEVMSNLKATIARLQKLHRAQTQRGQLSGGDIQAMRKLNSKINACVEEYKQAGGTGLIEKKE